MGSDSEYVACTDCGADVTSEKIKFQKAEGSILCEKCYILDRAKPSRYGSVRAIVVALRLAAYAVLALTFVSILSRINTNAYGVLRIAICGTLGFLLLIGLSEGLNIALVLSRQGLENRIKLDKILEFLESNEDNSRTL